MTDNDVASANILALQQVYFASMLEELSAFQAADRLLELFDRGLLPINAEPSFDAWRSARTAVSEAERRSLYARVLGTEGTYDLWTRFVSEVSAIDRQQIVAIEKQVHAAIAVLSHPDVRSARNALVEKTVRELFTRSDAYRSLSEETREQIARDSTRIGAALIADVDFPDFVAELIHGTFGAIVNASIRQMEAYAKLVHDVAESLDANLRDSDFEDCLQKRVGGRRRIASTRQQLLSTMVLMGINRVVSNS